MSFEEFAGKKSFIRGDIFTANGYVNVTLPYISIGEQEESHVAEFKKLIEKTTRGAQDPRAWELYLRRHHSKLIQHALISAAEAKRVDPIKAAEDTFRKLGFNEFEQVRVKSVTTSAIPIDPEAMARDLKYRMDLAAGGERAKNARSPFTNFDPNKGVVKQVDTDLNGYYLLEKNSLGTHNIMYLNDLMAGHFVTDMDADEFNALLMRERDAQGNIIREEAISLKYPITQAMSRFKNINYEKNLSFDQKRLFNISSVDIGLGLNPYNFEEVSPGKRGTRIFDYEKKAGQYSVLGDFYRMGNHETISEVEQVRKMAAKELEDPLTGIVTNLHDLQAMYLAAVEINDLKTHQPQKYEERLKLAQRMAREQLDNFKRDGNTKATHGKFFDYFEKALEPIRDGNGRYNNALEQMLQTELVGKRMVDASNPQRLYDAELRMKASRGGQTALQDNGILDTFNMMLKNRQLLFQTNKISNLKHSDAQELIDTLLNNGEDIGGMIRNTFGAVSLNDFTKNTRTMAEFIKGKRSSAINVRDYDQENTILKRLTRSGIVEFGEISAPSKYIRSDLVGTPGYNPNITTMMFRGVNGDLDHPFGADNNFEIPLLGNMGLRDSNGNIQLKNSRAYLEQVLEESVDDKLRGFLSTEGFFEHSNLANVLIGGGAGNQTSFRQELMDAYGITDINDAIALGKNLKNAGQNSDLHLDLVKEYNLKYNSGALHKIRSTLENFIEAHGFRTMNPVTIENGKITHVDEADLMRAAVNVGVDMRVNDPSVEEMANIAANFTQNIGGIHAKSTSQMKGRVMNFRLGASAGSFLPVGLDTGIGGISSKSASRAANITKQIGGGGIMLGHINVAFGDSQVAEDLFKMYELNADLAPKRSDEGLILVSQSFHNKLMNKVFDSAKIGPTLSEEEFLHSGRSGFINYMMSSFNYNADSTLTLAEQKDSARFNYNELFDSMYERTEYNGKVKYNLTEEGKRLKTSTILKLDSLWGDKAIAVTPGNFGKDPTGRDIDIFVGMNQIRTRESLGQTYGGILETALDNGRIDPSQHTDVFESTANGWALRNRQTFTGVEESYARALKEAAFEGEIDLGGIKSKVNMFHSIRDDFAVAAVFADRYATKDVNLAIRSNAVLSLMGQAMNVAENIAGDQVGEGLVGAGLQIAIATIGQQLKNASSHIIGQSGESITQAEFLQASKQTLSSAVGRSAALQEVAMEQAAQAMGGASSIVSKAIAQSPGAAADAAKRGKATNTPMNTALTALPFIGGAGFILANKDSSS